LSAPASSLRRAVGLRFAAAYITPAHLRPADLGAKGPGGGVADATLVSPAKTQPEAFIDVGKIPETKRPISNFLVLAIFCTPNFGILGQYPDCQPLVRNQEKLAVVWFEERILLLALNEVWPGTNRLTLADFLGLISVVSHNS
jgi:hypothetical protein